MTKQSIIDYMNTRPELRVEPYGTQYKLRIGERSHLSGLFSNRPKADRALIQHVGSMMKKAKEQQEKRNKTNAKKSKS